MNNDSSAFTKGQAIYALVILVLINSVNYMDRYVVGILFPLIKADLDLSDSQLGLLGGIAFTVFYAIMALPMGLAVDRFRRKYVLVFGIFLWSLATFSSGLAGRFITLFTARAFTGTGESSAHPAGVSMLGDYFSEKVRATMIAVFQMGVPLGAGLGIILGGILAVKYGWQKTFFIYATPGIILIPFILFMKEPVRGGSEGLTADASERIELEGFGTKVRKILSLRTLRYHYAATALIMFGSQGFNIWMPSYLERVWHYDLAVAGKIAGIAMLVGGVVGALGGAIIADIWSRKDSTARIKTQALAALIAVPFMFLVLITQSKSILIASFFIAVILSVAMFPILSAIIVNLTEPQDRGVAMALLLLFQTGIGFSLGPAFVGWTSDIFNHFGFENSLIYGLVVLPLSYIVVAVMGILALRHFRSDYEMVQKKIADLAKK
ncbi:MAG: MFS transporter [Deltaproteobacteria bacterium]|uniref:MFS transporter n=1 Tax=Candidatus Zymogenus saltonus TaxID=2844893 RepID=A0A9D8PPI6_9DELT|nr:MFS transporter [Candidatus Zymogenus saltonus]